MSVDDFLGGGFMQGASDDEDDGVSSTFVLRMCARLMCLGSKSEAEAMDEDDEDEDAGSEEDVDDNESFADVDDLEGAYPCMFSLVKKSCLMRVLPM